MISNVDLPRPGLKFLIVVACLIALGVSAMVLGLTVGQSGSATGEPTRTVNLRHGAVSASGEFATERIFSVHLDCGDSPQVRALNRTFGHGLRCLRFNVVAWDATINGSHVTVARRVGTSDHNVFSEMVGSGLESYGGGFVSDSQDAVDSNAIVSSFTGSNSSDQIRVFFARQRRALSNHVYRISTGVVHGERVYALRSKVPYLNHCCVLPGIRQRPHPPFVAYFDAKTFVLVGLQGNGWGMSLERELVVPISRVPESDLQVQL